MRQILLQNETDILLQNATEVYYKMQQSLQNATILLQNATVITNCDFITNYDSTTHTKLFCFNTWLAYFQSKFVRPLH